MACGRYTLQQLVCPADASAPDPGWAEGGEGVGSGGGEGMGLAGCSARRLPLNEVTYLAQGVAWRGVAESCRHLSSRPRFHSAPTASRFSLSPAQEEMRTYTRYFSDNVKVKKNDPDNLKKNTLISLHTSKGPFHFDGPDSIGQFASIVIYPSPIRSPFQLDCFYRFVPRRSFSFCIVHASRPNVPAGADRPMPHALGKKKY